MSKGVRSCIHDQKKVLQGLMLTDLTLGLVVLIAGALSSSIAMIALGDTIILVAIACLTVIHQNG